MTVMSNRVELAVEELARIEESGPRSSYEWTKAPNLVLDLRAANLLSDPELNVYLQLRSWIQEQESPIWAEPINLLVRRSGYSTRPPVEKALKRLCALRLITKVEKPLGQHHHYELGPAGTEDASGSWPEGDGWRADRALHELAEHIASLSDRETILGWSQDIAKQLVLARAIPSEELEEVAEFIVGMALHRRVPREVFARAARLVLTERENLDWGTDLPVQFQIAQATHQGCMFFRAGLVKLWKDYDHGIVGCPTCFDTGSYLSAATWEREECPCIGRDATTRPGMWDHQHPTPVAPYLIDKAVEEVGQVARVRAEEWNLGVRDVRRQVVEAHVDRLPSLIAAMGRDDVVEALLDEEIWRWNDPVFDGEELWKSSIVEFTEQVSEDWWGDKGQFDPSVALQALAKIMERRSNIAAAADKGHVVAMGDPVAHLVNVACPVCEDIRFLGAHDRGGKPAMVRCPNCLLLATRT